MANMSYCRYENTYRDLSDVWNALQEEAESGEKLSKTEESFRDQLIELCKNIADNGDQLVQEQKEALEEMEG